MNAAKAKTKTLLFVHVTLLALIGVCFPAVPAGWNSPQQEPSTQEKALRARIEEFYGLLQLGQREKAEAYVTEDSKDNFRTVASNNPILGFQLDSIKLDAEGKSATVTVQVQIVSPFARGPLAVPRAMRWRLVEGTWYAVIPKPEPIKTIFQQPQKKAPAPENLKFKTRRVALGMMQPGEVRTARFPFTNSTDHLVTISEVITGCECLRVKLGKKEYKSGESGELVIEFDSTDRMDVYEQTIIIKSQPGDSLSYLNVHVYIHRPPPPVPKPEGEQQKAAKP